MDLTYLIVAVFGMCVLRPCRSLPTVSAAAAAAAAVAPTPTPSEPTLQVAAAEPANNSKRSRSLQFQSPHPYHHQFHDGGGVDLYNDVMDNLPFYMQQQQQQQQQQEQQQQQQLQFQQLQQESEDELRDGEEDADENAVDQGLRLSSRARPAKPDSPVYFIRLPPQPYMYVPGYGYVSQPTRLEPPPFTQRPHSPFLNLPLDFVANGKPVGVYTLPQQSHGEYQQQQQQQQQQQSPGRPKPNRRPQPIATTTTPAPRPSRPDSPVYNLDKGPYVFNGRPAAEVFLLQTAYDNLYSEVLQNIYP